MPVNKYQIIYSCIPKMCIYVFFKFWIAYIYFQYNWLRPSSSPVCFPQHFCQVLDHHYLRQQNYKVSYKTITLLKKFKGANMLEKQIFNSLVTFLLVITKYWKDVKNDAK